MLEVLLVMSGLVVCLGSAFIMIARPGLGSKLGDNSIITAVYDWLPPPWNRRVVRGCGMILLLVSLLFFGMFFLL